jgi:hypothetical protein
VALQDSATEREREREREREMQFVVVCRLSTNACSCLSWLREIGVEVGKRVRSRVRVMTHIIITTK